MKRQASTIPGDFDDPSTRVVGAGEPADGLRFLPGPAARRDAVIPPGTACRVAPDETGG